MELKASLQAGRSLRELSTVQLVLYLAQVTCLAAEQPEASETCALLRQELRRREWEFDA